MKRAFIVSFVVAVGVAGYLVFNRQNGGGVELNQAFQEVLQEAPPQEPGATPESPAWAQGIPDGARLLKNEAEPEFNVLVIRRDVGTQAQLEFQITEEHGYMADGILLEFWYRRLDGETGEWIDDTGTIKHFVKGQLGFNDTLVESTSPLPHEFPNIETELADTTDENWRARVIRYDRAMVPND